MPNQLKPNTCAIHDISVRPDPLGSPSFGLEGFRVYMPGSGCKGLGLRSTNSTREFPKVGTLI